MTTPTIEPINLRAGDRTPEAVGGEAARRLQRLASGRTVVRLADTDVIYNDAWTATTDLRTGLAIFIRRADCGGGCRCAAEVMVSESERMSGPKIITDTEWEAFELAVDKLQGLAVRIENPGEVPVEMVVHCMGRAGDEPGVIGASWNSRTGEFDGPLVTVRLDDNVTVVVL